MEEVYKKFSELYAIHDWFFCEEKGEKQEMMKEMVDEINSLLDALPTEVAESIPAEVAFVRGKALNALDGNIPEAEEYLSRAIKLDPSNVSAWMAMGQCAWKKGDISQAKHFFEESLKHGETKEAYQDLSMITRQIREKGTNVGEIMQESINLAKKAISIDIGDHKSWYVLGNAHCMKFFAVTSEIQELNKALAAYKKSEALGGDCNPDLFYNRGNVYRYLQEYTKAMESYSRTLDIDPSFSETSGTLQDVRHFVERVNDMVAHKAWTKKKKFESILKELQNSPYSAGSCSFADLCPGVNNSKTICIKVLMTATKPNVPPECFVCTDISGYCAVVSIYNLSGDAPRLNSDQVLSIRNPFVNNEALDVPCSTSAKEEFKPAMLVQVFDINNVNVDGNTISSKVVAPPKLKVDLFSS